MSNRLAQESSLYLRQHADNPVDWFPWGEEALEKARTENKPILLSIGYSACHWCHVMAHESFEDKETAAVMNDLFINIKVDREERPDLDKIYQMAHQMLTERPGGWPLTMFLTAQAQSPFYGGTYFPKEPRYGLPSFKDLLQRVAQAYHQQSAEVKTQSDSVSHSLEQIFKRGGGTLNKNVLLMVRGQLQQDFDAVDGGFGAAPKFPHVPSMERLLRHYLRSRKHSPQADEEVLHTVAFSLEKMALGGIYDQLGGGFCRYSVDEHWMIPHFEKMLYDNGPLLAIYSQMAYLKAQMAADSDSKAESESVNEHDVFHRAAKGIADWTIRDMQAPEGGYYSTLDADSEGHEGLFYIWTPDEIKALLTEDEYRVFAPRFGLDRDANFEGRWNLHVYQRVEELSQTLSLDKAQIRQYLQRASDKLLAVREQRVWPGRDEKILTAWNALMIRGMAIAARSLQGQKYADSAERALDFIRSQLWQNGRLLANYNGGKASIPAYLDDYAFLLDAILELLQYRWCSKDLHFATQLADVLLTHFEDQEQGGFYFTADDHEQLLQRPKSYGDDSLPAGNAVAALSLLRLGYLLSDTRYLDAAERTLQSAAVLMSQVPKAYCALLNAYEDYLHAPQLVILRGSNEALPAWHRQGADAVLTQRLVFAIPEDAEHLPEALAAKKPLENADNVIAYLCSGLQCEPPITDFEVYQQRL